MQFHHHTLRHLARWLEANFVGGSLAAVFSQNRNELILQLQDGRCLRIGCHTPLTYLVPSDSFSRARRNVVDLFPELLGRSFTGFRVVPQDRVLVLSLADGYELVAKMHSISANVILQKDQKTLALFNQSLDGDWDYQEQPGPYDEAALDQPVPADPKAVKQAMRAVSPIYDKQFAARCLHWLEQGLTFRAAVRRCEQEAAADEAWLEVHGNRVTFSIIPVEGEQVVRKAPVIAALRLFLRVYFQFEAYRQQYKEAEQSLKKPLEKRQRLLASYQENIERLESLRDPEEIGHILMAHLHAVTTGDKSVTLPDLYLGGKLEISLDPKLSPQENATRYYQKHKSRKLQLAHLREQVEEIEEELLEQAVALEAFNALVPPEALALDEHGWSGEAFAQMKAFAKDFRADQQTQARNLVPYRQFRREGYDIFVGKNARNNDELSFKFANKQDLWLHAKDVTGSHVVIRLKAGKDLPPSVLEYAAQLAAFYSKRKHDSLVPVIYTPRKYIRKRKGDPPGLVAVDREQVIMVEPIRE